MAVESGSYYQDWDDETRSVRTGTYRSQFGEHSEAMFLTSSYVFQSAAEAAARFSEAEPGYTYSRFTNPSVSMFEERLAALEGAERCVATASGMSAILAVCMATLKAGDHIVASQSLFGSTIGLFNNILTRFGISTSYVPLNNAEAWGDACNENTKLFFMETPSNPLLELGDISAVSAVAKSKGVLLAVDNCFATPILQKPISLGADMVVHSATKYIDGQGRVLGGAVLGSNELMQQVFLFLRTAGPTLSAFNAWTLFKSLETLPLRMERHCQSALELATWLESHPAVSRVFHPGLASHPQFELAARQQKFGGGVLSFIVKGGRESAWKVIDATQLISITGNLGDAKSTITHPASTTHFRISPEAREVAGVVEGLLRVSVGLESVDDLKRDLARGLDSLAI
ncbi:O-succinylhomoserine sulfhydrylase [Leeia sp. TBRC 13508]|uniref:O-succinylhomoserine sulfhydrylase n=1 Tax=Leeia speluncae TaxID=2884804 RepID=A0ABS8DBF8_9NEIS|nr:O-succinylhomoserine sulfhydrylase [Leeia speluncae]MCB6185261.1 O-succinylhomoserine sulfhydrylase [Leeia speluncae]